MEKNAIMLACVGLFTSSACFSKTLVDEICGVVNGAIVTYSDLHTPQISKDGRPFSFDEKAAQMLWLQRAHARQMEPAADDVERSIVVYKQENGLSGLKDEAVDALLLKQIGITLAMYRQQLTDHYMVESLKSYEFRSRCSVSEVEVRTYHDRHPEVVGAQYKIELALLTAQQKADIATDPEVANRLLWDQFDWISHDDVAPHLQSVYSLQPGVLSSIITHNGQDCVVRVRDKKEAHALTLNDRYASIERLLQHRKVAALDMDSELRADAVIVQY